MLLAVVALSAMTVVTDPGRLAEHRSRRQLYEHAHRMELEEATKKIRRDSIVISIAPFVAGGLVTLKQTVAAELVRIELTTMSGGPTQRHRTI